MVSYQNWETKVIADDQVIESTVYFNPYLAIHKSCLYVNINCFHAYDSNGTNKNKQRRENASQSKMWQVTYFFFGKIKPAATEPVSQLTLRINAFTAHPYKNLKFASEITTKQILNAHRSADRLIT